MEFSPYNYSLALQSKSILTKKQRGVTIGTKAWFFSLVIVAMVLIINCREGRSSGFVDIDSVKIP